MFLSSNHCLGLTLSRGGLHGKFPSPAPYIQVEVLLLFIIGNIEFHLFCYNTI